MEEKHEHFIADSKVKMTVSEKIKANMNARNKIFGKHKRQFLHKNIVQLGSLTGNTKRELTPGTTGLTTFACAASSLLI